MRRRRAWEPQAAASPKCPHCSKQSSVIRWKVKCRRSEPSPLGPNSLPAGTVCGLFLLFFSPGDSLAASVMAPMSLECCGNSLLGSRPAFVVPALGLIRLGAASCGLRQGGASPCWALQPRADSAASEKLVSEPLGQTLPTFSCTSFKYPANGGASLL